MVLHHAWTTFASLLTITASAAVAAAQDPATAAPVSACRVAEDPEYGFTPQKPVQVGGGPMFFAARQRRVLDVLRGRDGQTIRYKRLGSTEGPDGTMLDMYEVVYDGLDKPLKIYMDGYHFNEPLAPQNLACAVAINLAPPGPDPFRAAQSLVRLAIDQGPAAQITPIPLDADGTTTHGVVFDKFRVMALRARAVARSGQRLDPESPPADVARAGTVVIAYPRRCEERTIEAVAIDIVDPQGRPLPRQGGYVKGDAIETLLPSVSAPASSLAAVFGLERPRPTDTMRITYAQPCGPTSNEVSLALKFAPGKSIETPAPALPEGAPSNAAPVLLQVLIDLNGTPQQAEYIGGPSMLTKAAIEAIKQWRFEPPRVNGAPAATAVMLQVKFGSR
jgi:hypothetical protein